MITTNDIQHNATIHVGDALDILTAMPDATADCIVTSPPYWAKRDYGITGQYGHESDPAAYIATLVAVFSQARRVLADDGTCWLNLGNCYSAGSRGRRHDLLLLPGRPCGFSAIAEKLTAQGIPSPSAHDPKRRSTPIR